MARDEIQGQLPLVERGHNFREPQPDRLSSFEERLNLFLHECQHGNISFVEKIRHLGRLAESSEDMEKLIDKLRRY
jgi:hypothetical protein